MFILLSTAVVAVGFCCVVVRRKRRAEAQAAR